MENNENKDVVGTETTNSGVGDTSTTENDLKIENDALKQLLTENKQTMDALRKELTEVKTTNAKLLNQVSIGNQTEFDIEENINNLFNRYERKK